MSYQIVFTDELYHHGIKGQKWGTRRWQNEDGTFNPAGKERYFGSKSNKKIQKINERYNKKINETQDETKKQRLEQLQKKAVIRQEAKENWSDKRKDFTSSLSVGNSVGKFLLLGPFGSYTYNSMRTAGYNPLVSAGAGVVSSALPVVGSVAISSLVSGVDKYKYEKRNENKYDDK